MLFLFYGFTPAYTLPPPGSNIPLVQWMHASLPHFVLDADQHIILNMFQQRQESTLAQIDLLYENLEQLRTDLSTVLFTYYGLPPLPLYTNTTMMGVTFPSTRQTEYPQQQQQQQQQTTTMPEAESSTPSTPASLPSLVLFETTIMPTTTTTTTEGNNNIDETFPTWLTAWLQSPSLNTLPIPGRSDGVRNNTTLDELLQQFYNPVVVAPSVGEIAHASRRLRFQDIEQPVNIVCPISLDIFRPDQEVTQLIHCGHIFDTAQIQQWFTAHVHCPMCRHDIRRETSTPPSQAPSRAPSQAPRTRLRNRRPPSRLTPSSTVPPATTSNTSNSSGLYFDPSHNVYHSYFVRFSESL
jgi:hypothetical protein